MLSIFIKESTNETNGFIEYNNKHCLYFYNAEYMNNKQIKEFKQKLEDILIEFNNIFSSAYYIEDVFLKKSPDSQKKYLTAKLKGEVDKSNKNYTYSPYFYLLRGNEEEYLIQIEMIDEKYPIVK